MAHFWSVLVGWTLIFCSLIYPTIGSLNAATSTLFYKEHRIQTSQLCPDLQESTASRDIDTANYPYKTTFKLAEQVWRTADPCIFEARGPRNSYTTLLIKAITPSDRPWNYSGAATCSDHIKLRLPSNRRIFSKVGLPLCTVRRPSDPSSLFQGPYYHPHIWQLSKQKMGISFALYENETEGVAGENDGIEGEENNEISQPNGFLLNAAKLPKFLHVVFASFFGDSCSLRVQQYVLDPSREVCNNSKALRKIYSLCGTYNCSEEEGVLQQAGFPNNGDSIRLTEMHKLLDFVRAKQFRSLHEPSPFDFILGMMRLMITPCIFLVAYYVTRQLKERLMNRQLLRQVRSLSQVGSLSRGADRMGLSSRPIIESPSPSAREDPPPPYENIMTPPSYLEATKFAFSSQLPSSSSATFVMERSSESGLPPPPMYCPTINTVPQGNSPSSEESKSPDDINETEEIKIVNEVEQQSGQSTTELNT